jgi:hypothetical protein
MTLELLVSDAAIGSVTLESRIMILDALVTIIYDVYSTIVTK